MNEKILGVTGTQNGATEQQLIQFREILIQLRPVILHHGDCIGVDAEFNTIARHQKILTVAHPPEFKSKRAFVKVDHSYPEKPYLVRNHDIVDACQLLIGAPKESEEILRSGTWATLRWAHRVRRQYVIILPDGTLRWNSLS